MHEAARVRRFAKVLGMGELPSAENDAHRLSVWKAVENRQRDPMAHLRWAIFSLTYGRSEEATRVLRQAASLADTAAEVVYAQALLHLVHGSNQLAIDCLVRASRLPSRNQEILELILSDLVALGHFEAASELIERRLGAGTDTREIRLSIVAALLKKAAHAEALPLLRQFQRELPMDTGVNAALGFVLCSLGRYAEAARELEKAVGGEAADPEKWGLLGAACSALGQRDRALEAFDRAVELDPGFFDDRPDQRAMWEAALRTAADAPKVTLIWRLELG